VLNDDLSDKELYQMTCSTAGCFLFRNAVLILM